MTAKENPKQEDLEARLERLHPNRFFGMLLWGPGVVFACQHTDEPRIASMALFFDHTLYEFNTTTLKFEYNQQEKIGGISLPSSAFEFDLDELERIVKEHLKERSPKPAAPNS